MHLLSFFNGPVSFFNGPVPFFNGPVSFFNGPVFFFIYSMCLHLLSFLQVCLFYRSVFLLFIQFSVYIHACSFVVNKNRRDLILKYLLWVVTDLAI